MPYDRTAQSRVAVIGGGISGLTAAWALSRDHSVTLYEAAPRLGGHARTVMAGRNGDQPVDTGFIVFNRVNYPGLTAMFDQLGVPTKPSDMSFGASIEGGRLEYALTKDLKAIAAQPANLLKPRFLGMLRDITRFHRDAVQTAQDPEMTIAQLIETLGLGDAFRDHFLLPMSGAIWSSTPEQMLYFPARALVQFFDNHALLGRNTHQWYTVDGGSVEYLRRLESDILRHCGRILTDTPVANIRRDGGLITLFLADGTQAHYDELILACHSDQALALLGDVTRAERAVLSAIRYQPNRAVLHADTTQMPKRRGAWASWVYRTPDTAHRQKVGITYWMNSLQGIDPSDPLFVSLNPADDIREELIYDETSFDHPVFDRAALAAQAELPDIQGLNRTWFAGAWTRHGFHEDGHASGLAAAQGVIERRIRQRVAA